MIAGLFPTNGHLLDGDERPAALLWPREHELLLGLAHHTGAHAGIGVQRVGVLDALTFLACCPLDGRIQGEGIDGKPEVEDDVGNLREVAARLFAALCVVIHGARWLRRVVFRLSCRPAETGPGGAKVSPAFSLVRDHRPLARDFLLFKFLQCGLHLRGIEAQHAADSDGGNDAAF